MTFDPTNFAFGFVIGVVVALVRISRQWRRSNAELERNLQEAVDGLKAWEARLREEQDTGKWRK